MSANLWMQNRPWIDRDGADIDGYLASLDQKPTYDLKQKLQQWSEKGFVVFEGAVPELLIDTLLDDIRDFQQNYSRYRIPIEVRGAQIESSEVPAFPENETGIKLNHLHCLSGAAALLSLNPLVMNFLGHIFREPPAALQSLTFWRGSQQPIHIDYPYVRVQKNLSYLAASWIPLEDVHPDAGPLGYYPGGHKVERSGFFDWGQGSILNDEKSTRTPMEFANFLWDRMKQQGIRREDFCPKRGDVFIWHGNLPHEGTKVVNPTLTRKSFVTHFTSRSNLPTWMECESASAEGRCVSANGGYLYAHKGLATRPKLPSWHKISQLRFA